MKFKLEIFKIYSKKVFPQIFLHIRLFFINPHFSKYIIAAALLYINM